MKATNEARCVFYQRDWSAEELEAGECDADNEAFRNEYDLTLLEIAKNIRGWQISDSHEINEYTFANTGEDNYNTGGRVESSLHLTFEATKQEKRIWIKALEFAKRNGWV